MSKSERERVLVISQNYLGDVLFTTPALAALARRFPQTPIDCLVSERAAPLLEHNPHLATVLTRPANGGSKARWRALTQTLATRCYTTCVIFHGTALSALLASWYRVPHRLGFAAEHAGWLLTAAAPAHQPGEHFADAFLRAVGGSDGTERLSLTLTDDETEAGHAAIAALAQGRPAVGLAIATTRPQKNWPEAHFAPLCDRLTAAGYTPILLGSPAEAALAERIAAQTQRPPATLVGQLALRPFAAALAALDLLVTGDTGPLHLAVALGIPTVALFGSTDPKETGPWRESAPTKVLYDALPCAPCRKHPTCDGSYPCLSGITPERVFGAVQECLGRHQPLALVPEAQG